MVSANRPRLLVLGFLLLGLAGVPLLGSGCGVTRVSEREEIRAGQQVAQQIEQQYRTYADPAVTRIGRELAAASQRPSLPWSFRVIERPEINAVSLPGGPVYIYEGLLRKIGSDEGMLAGVLGHEVGHVEKKHAVRQMERQQWFGLGTAVLDRIVGGDIGSASRIAANLELLSYSRKQEYEADDAAIRLLRRTNRNPQGLVRLLALLQAEGGRGQTIHWLRTHPTTAARIDRAQDRIAQARS